MKITALAVLALVAAAQADYHDDVFHFTTVNRPTAQSYRTYQQPRYTVDNGYKAYKTYDAYNTVPSTSYYQPASTYSHQQYRYYQPQQTYAITPAVTTVSDYTPNAVLQAPVYHQQPAITVYTSQVPATTSYSSVSGHGLGLSGLGHAVSGYNGHSSLYPSGFARSYAPNYSGPQYRILKQVQEVDPSGPYRAHYATENGISATEEGSLTAPGPEGPAVAKRGSYSYTGPDGVQYTVNWVADENGYRASGAHLPQAPESPQAHLVEAQRSIQYSQSPFSSLYGK